MNIALLIELPLIVGLLSFFVRQDWLRRCLLVLVAIGHLGLTIGVWILRPSADPTAWLAIDALGLVFLGITSLLFCASAFYGIGYLQREGQQKEKDWGDGFIFRNTPEAVFVGCLILFLAAMTAVILSRHFGVMWVAMEATTLVSAPLIYFHRHPRSLEATWKYILICSVGIALALLGNLFLAVSALPLKTSLLLPDMLQNSATLSIPWLKLAFLFLIVGYGTKMGLAPLHTWLPDAHSEAPSVVSALLSGALLNCAFLCILRVYQLCLACGLGDFSRDIFLLFAFLSLAIAAVFILGQRDYKRMLAYSSIEHMGILALGVGLGGGAVFGALLHAVNHSLTKTALFFTAGNILGQYHTKKVGEVQGILRVLPISGVLWIAGFFAITGTPPGGIFLSKFLILQAAFAQGQSLAAVAFLVLLAVVFIGMIIIFLPMAQGVPSPEIDRLKAREAMLHVLSAVILLSLVLVLGLYLPPFLSESLSQAASMIGAK